jgi:hypothetical protein
VNALDKLTYLVSYADTDWLDAHFDLDAGPDDIARTIHGEIRGEVLREAAEVMDAHCEQYGVFGVGDRLRRMTDAGQAGTAGRCRADIETALGTYPCERNTGHDGDCDERTEAEIAGTGSAPSGETTQPDNFFQPDHTYGDAEYDWKFRCDTVTTHPENSERTALGWRFFNGEWEPYAYHEDDWEIHQLVGHTDGGDTTQTAPDFFQPGHGYTHRYGYDFLCVAVTTHPVTGERLAIGWHSEHGVPIAVGINQWNHEYDGASPPADHGSIEDAHSATELYEMDRDAEFRLDAEDDARNTDAVEADERGDA